MEKLLVPYVKKKTFANISFAVMRPRLWNDLPRNLRECQNSDTFKKLLETHLVSKVFYK